MNKQSIRNLIKNPNPTIFEIGCADGIDTKEFLDVFGDNIKLYCFEPDERNIEVFTRGGFRPINPNFTAPIISESVIFEPKAVGNINGTVRFNQSSTIYSSSLKNPTDNLFKTWSDINFEKFLEVESVTLDTYVEEKGIILIDFIWADVQGAEDYLIEGGKKTFENKVKYFYTEYANVKYYENSPSKEDILNLLGPNWVIYQDFGTDVLLKNTLFDNE